MKVIIKVGDKVIRDSSENKVAKVIEADEKIDILKDTVKEEKPIQDKVQSRINKPKAKAKKSTNIPSDSIFRKEEVKTPVSEKKETKEEDKSEIKKSNENKTSLETMNDELDNALNDSLYDEDDYDDDYSEYDEYLSNRERKNIRNANKKTKTRNKDFSDF